MGSGKTNRARHAMLNRAKKVIGSKHTEPQEALIESLLDGVDIPGCNAAITELLAANIPSPRIMMTLLQCQPILFNLLADLKKPNSWRDISSRFFRIQETLIAQSESIAMRLDDSSSNQQEEDVHKTENRDQTNIFSDPTHAPYIAWLRDHPELRLFNIFRGVVINANCALLDIDEEKGLIAIELNHELGRVLSADPATKAAMLIINDNRSLTFPIHLVDHSPGKAIFTPMPPQETHLDKRDGIDVHIQDLVHVDILKGIYRFPSGTLIDFSATGIGLVAPKDDRMQIKLNDILEFRYKIGSAKVIAEGRIRGLTEQEDRYILGVHLKTNRATQSLLQREVFRVQREIIVTLNEEGIPEELLPDIR